jgi:hypothetical protein
MAKRTTTTKRKRATKSNSSNAEVLGVEIDYKEILRDLYASPTVRYIAGGIAAAFLNRYVNKISEKYPEVANFLKENIETFEGRLSEIKQGLDSSNVSQARH